MDDEILTKSFQRGMKRGISQRRAQEKKGTVWSGRAPTWQVKTKAAYTHTHTRTRPLTGRAIPPTTLSPEQWEEKKNRSDRAEPSVAAFQPDVPWTLPTKRLMSARP